MLCIDFVCAMQSEDAFDSVCVREKESVLESMRKEEGGRLMAGGEGKRVPVHICVY